jgi:hypothetical protein
VIIYQATQGRLYPKVVDAILNNIPLDIKFTEFHYHLLVEDNQYENSNNVLKMIPKDVKHSRYDGFLYGVFPSTQLNRRQNDFVFTIIGHPVKKIYDLYAYWIFTRKQFGPREVNYVTEAERKNPAKLWSAEAEVFKYGEDYSLEKYIDEVLEGKQFNIQYKDVKYQFISELFYGHTSYKDFDYVGSFDNLKLTFEKLSKVFKKDMPHPTDNRAYSYSGELYRLKDLENMFKEEIKFYDHISSNGW